MNQIKFWKTSHEHGYMSNFSKHSFQTNGVTYKTSEHYYQSMKFTNPEERQLVIDAPSAREAADIGRRRDLELRSDWDDIKDSIMFDALMFKFEQNKLIRDQLISTGQDELIEDSPYDYYWGCGKDGTGKNMLGKLLMTVREYLSVDWESNDKFCDFNF